MVFTDLIGKRIGRWLILSRAKNNKSGKIMWNCVCECGTSREVSSSSLTTGGTLSCGCFRTERQTKHGMNESRLYSIWENIIQRCYNPNSVRYEQYGGRGIVTCKEWKEDFANFRKDVFDGYNDELTLDRINPDLGYYKENCRWVLPEFQPRNKKKSPRNTSGITGVGLYDGAWRAFWSRLDGKLRCKNFSVKKYGNEEAFRLACEYREKQISILNEQGAGYSEFHGK